ncbi:hypothetical protein TWF718_009680 [Orbilia javanica]|uniref:Uncharacterized protein n=1 Tax=Orbilia javanica TaxID=47235 RepID=A0AAN8NQV8_9PEZI
MVAASGSQTLQGPTVLELVHLEAIAIATRSKDFLKYVFSAWKRSEDTKVDGLLDFLLYVARFIYDHSGWVIIDDLQPICNTFLQIVAYAKLMTRIPAEYLLSGILKGTVKEDQENLDGERYQSCLATATTIVEILWQKAEISPDQVRQWIFFQVWIEMEREKEREIAIPRSQTSFPQSWPICIEGTLTETPNPNAQSLPPISTLFNILDVQKIEMDAPPQNQTPPVAPAAPAAQSAYQGDRYQPADTASEHRAPHNGLAVIEAASENASTENADKRDYDKSPIQSITETRGCQLKVPSESESPPFGTEEASQSTRVTRQTRRLEKDKDLEESLPLEGGKRKLPRGVSSGGRRKRVQRQRAIILGPPSSIIVRGGELGSSRETPFAIED